MPLRALGALALLVVPLAAATLSCGAADGSGAPGGLAAALPDLRPATPSFSLESGDRIRVTFKLRNRGLPRRVRPGRYWVIACADVGHRVREASERNNCRRSRTRVRVPVGSLPGDRTAPRFSGVDSVTTCIPGPRGGQAGPSRFRLFWRAATDEMTARAAIAYDVFRAHTPGSLDLEHPTYATPPGAVTFTTPELSSTQTWYFLVRARDEAGNRDGNRVVREGQNQCR